MPDDLLRGNREWAQSVRQRSPDYFARLAKLQKPDYFWIGCADSRVPANVVTGRDAGRIFVHRNIANVIHSADVNLLSCLEFAIGELGIREIVVCGHYGCGGVKAAASDVVNGLTDHWIEPIRRIARQRADELDRLDENDRLNRLSELNVVDSVCRVSETPVVQRAWKAGEEIVVHGLIYGLDDGHLKDLGCSIRRPDS